jgi:hypothetical protein
MVRLLGANPCVTLYESERAVAFASLWRVDWSERGAGRAVIFGDTNGIRVIGPDPDLGGWLAGEFTRYFEDVLDGLPWSEPKVTVAPVELKQDLATGWRVSAGDVAVRIEEPLHRKLIRTDSYDLGGVPNVLSTVWMPCRHGSISLNGNPVAGAPKVIIEPDRISSSAFLADAEVWCHA